MDQSIRKRKTADDFDRAAYLAERKRKTTPLKTWSPVMTPEQQAAQERYIKDNGLPF